MNIIKHQKTFLFFIIFFLLNFNLSKAVSPIQIKQRGSAIITWEKGKRKFQFNQAIAIDLNNRFISQALDDFGNTLFWFVLTENELSLNENDQSKVKKLLKIPISSKVFLNIMQKKWTEKEIQDGKIVFNQKSKLKNQSYQIELSDFRKVNDQFYPYQMMIQSKKTKLHIHWQSLKFF